MFKKKGLKLGGESPKLSRTERDILYLLSDEYLSIRQVAIRRGTSVQAVYKTVQKLRDKGQLDRSLKKVEKIRPTLPMIKPNPAEIKPMFPVERIRLHAQEWNINLLYKGPAYKNLKEKGNTLFIDGNTIRLYNDSIEVYSGQSFTGEDAQKATAESFKYWSRFFVRLEHDLKVVILKPRKANFRLVNSHYAEMDNELAKECDVSGDKIRVQTTDDGKLWGLLDNSFNLHECETVHPETSKNDMQAVVAPFFNDLRDKQPPKASELSTAIWQTQQQLSQLAESQKLMITTFQTLLTSMSPPQVPQAPLERPRYFG